MKSNYKQQLKSLAETKRKETLGVVLRLREIEVLLALHREFGFGSERLKRFADALSDIHKEFNSRAGATDKYDRKGRELTNIDTAIIQAVQELRAAGIDHRQIFDDGCELVMTDEKGVQCNLDELLDKLENMEAHNDR